MQTTTIAEYFKSNRNYLRLSQTEMAKLLGCSRVSVSNYETGKAIPRADKYDRLIRLVARYDGE